MPNTYFEKEVGSLEINEKIFILTKATSLTDPVEKAIKKYERPTITAKENV